MSSLKSGLRVHIALIFVQISFSVFYVISKYVLLYTDPLFIAGLRIFLATPILLSLAWHHDRVRPSLRDLPVFALLGFLGIFANQVLYIIGVSYTSALSAGILMPAIPVFTAAIAAIVGIEKLTAKQWLGIGICVIGAWVMLDVSSLSMSGGKALGNALILLNGLSYALFLVIQRKLLVRLPPLTVIAWSFVFGALFVSLVSIRPILSADYSEIPAKAWIGLLYMVIIATALNYFLNTWAVSRSSTTMVASYIMLQPPVAAILAGFFLQETIGVRDIVGTILILGGLTSVSSRVNEKKRPR